MKEQLADFVAQSIINDEKIPKFLSKELSSFFLTVIFTHEKMPLNLINIWKEVFEISDDAAKDDVKRILIEKLKYSQTPCGKFVPHKIKVYSIESLMKKGKFINIEGKEVEVDLYTSPKKEMILEHFPKYSILQIDNNLFYVS